MNARFLCLALLAAGCGGSANGYARDVASAERAYSAGRYGEAADAWGRAGHEATHRRDRDEAAYRRAAALSRAGRTADEERALSELILRSPRGDSTPRALLDRARLRASAHDEAAAFSDFDAVVREHPESGVAPVALRECVNLVRPRGEGAVRAYLDERRSTLSKTAVGESLEARYAESLERSGDLAGAKARYLLLAAEYPYPRGALWDDALFHAADIAARTGAPKEAVELLERLLAARETAYVQGSYERGRYAEARFRLGELYRDALGDRARARAAFETLFTSHGTSRLRDDAAWNAALLAVQAGDEAGACDDLRALVAELPESRYAPCAPRLCSSVTPPRGGTCHEYLVRPPSAEPDEP